MHENPLAVARHRVAWKMVAAIQLLLLLLLGGGLAWWWRPEPHSDWLYYWIAAGEPSVYERGGLDLWLLAIPKVLGWSPVASALAINLPSIAWLCFLAYRIDRTRWRLLAQMVVIYLILLTPFAGIVQLDLIAAAQLATGFWLLADQRLTLRWLWRVVLGSVAILLAVSTKPQYALTLWTLLSVAAIAWVCARRDADGLLPMLLGTLLVGSILGFAIDMGMRQLSGRTQEIRTSSAVTLYGGLLVSSNSLSRGCGYWSVEAAQAAKDDLDKPLHIAVRDRMAKRPISHWLSVVGCKVPQIIKPPPYALYWLIESPNIRASINASPMRERIDVEYYRAIKWEKRAYGWLTTLILLSCFWTTARLWRKLPTLALLPTLWIISFWCVHLVFEIQGRYFLGMFVLAPLLCALLYQCNDTAGHPAASARPM